MEFQNKNKKLGKFYHIKQDLRTHTVNCGIIVLMMIKALLSGQSNLEFDINSLNAYCDRLVEKFS